MSFKSCYNSCLECNNIKLLVTAHGEGTILGYRVYNYDAVTDSRSIYDFAIDMDELKTYPKGDLLCEFLEEVTPILDRVIMVMDSTGGFSSPAELNNNFRVVELVGEQVVEPLCNVVKSFVVSGTCELKKYKDL